jgi:hypothetical protein
VSISPEKSAIHKLAAERLWVIKKLGEQIEQLGAENKRLKAQVILQMKWKTAAQNDNDRLCEVNATLLEALKWIDRRCPKHLLDSDLHKIHREAAYDAGASARAAIAKAGEVKP